MLKILRRCGPLAVALLLVPGLVAAATTVNYPTKPIRLVVSFAAGGGTDIFARAMAPKFTEAWGKPVIIDNRAGGNGNIGTDLVAKAPADGYTLLMTTNATIAINPHLAKLPYDPVKDFAPISHLAALPFALSVHPSSPAKTVRELIELARAKPGQLNFASSGAGGGAHLAGELLKTMAKIDMTHVAYKGGGPAMTGLLTREVDFLFLSVLTSMPLIKGGKVRVLAVSSPKRSPALPDVPTVAETPGLEGFESDLWYGFLAPAKTDPKIIDKIYQETRRVLTSAEFKNLFEPTGTELVASSPSEFAKTIKKDLAKWATVIKASGAKMD